MKLTNIFLATLLSGISSAASALPATWTCQNFIKQHQNKLVVAYVNAGTLPSMQQSRAINVINYAFVGVALNNNGDYILNLTPQDLGQIEKINQIAPDIPIILSVGGWGGREEFTSFLTDDRKLNQFALDAINKIKRYRQYNIVGIDLDWENESIAANKEVKGVGALLTKLSQLGKPAGLCVTNAVPATAAYWLNYPPASSWARHVNWTTIMSYDHYGTFGPYTEFGASLYPSDRHLEQPNPVYPYPTTSSDDAVKH